MMIEFLPDPDALLSEIDFGLDDHVPGDDHGDGTTDPMGDLNVASDTSDVPLEPDPFLEQSQDVVTDSTVWAVAADIPLPNPFHIVLAGSGLLGAASRRRARKAAGRRGARTVRKGT
jgi:hypothetical protein